MSLPKINHHLFKITIPSTKKSLNFRPYTVKEEKLLLMMKDSKEISEVVDVVTQIINNCSVDNLDVKSLAIFDIEYIFIKLRAKSVGEEIPLTYNENDNKINFIVDLDKVEVKFNPEHKKSIPLYNDIGVNMKYPSYNSMLLLEKFLGEKKNIDEFIYELILECIENVYDDKQIYTEFTREDLEAFILSLPIECSEKIRQFFETMPSLEHTVTLNLKNGEKKEVTLRGMKDFFIL